MATIKISRNWLIYGGVAIGAVLLALYVVIPFLRRFLMKSEDVIRRALTVKALEQEQQYAVRLLVENFAKYGDGDKRKLAYILATVWHESRFRSIQEKKASSGSDVYEMQQKYWNTGYFGRGYIQLTWKGNYEKFSKILGVDLVNDPEKALDPKIAAQIAVIGMMRGLFTGKKLGDYFNAVKTDWVNARKVVNNDVSRNGESIAKTAQQYYKAIK